MEMAIALAMTLGLTTSIARPLAMLIAMTRPPREGASFGWKLVARKRERKSVWIRVRAVVIDARTEFPSVTGFGRS